MRQGEIIVLYAPVSHPLTSSVWKNEYKRAIHYSNNSYSLLYIITSTTSNIQKRNVGKCARRAFVFYHSTETLMKCSNKIYQTLFWVCMLFKLFHYSEPGEEIGLKIIPFHRLMGKVDSILHRLHVAIHFKYDVLCHGWGHQNYAV